MFNAFFPIFDKDEIVYPKPNQFGLGISQYIAKLVVDHQPATIQRHMGDANGGLINDAAAIGRIRDNAALRADLIARGLDRARRCYSQDVIMNQIVDFYGQVLGRHATA